MDNQSFLINEIYPCLQGEGFNLGRPSLLVRFQICNLRCTWCDTPYTHTYKSDPIAPDQPSLGQAFQRMTLEELVNSIQESSQKHLILTGGEPTLQNIAAILKNLDPVYTAEVESNGTRIPHSHFKSFDFQDYFRFQWNISPKGNNAGEKWVVEALSHWAELAKIHPLVFFKFVVRKDHQMEDLAEVMDFVTRFGVLRDRVYLMAEGTSMDSQLSNIWLHDICLKEGFRYTPRLHVLLFGAQRGV